MRSAIRNSGFPFPNRRITVNLAPTDLRKEGPAYDAREDRRCPITVVYNLQHRAMLEHWLLTASLAGTAIGAVGLYAVLRRETLVTAKRYPLMSSAF